MTDLSKSRLRFGPFDVDLDSRELRKSGVRVKLSRQPFEILAALLESPGQLVSRDELRKRIWSEDTFVDFGHGLNAAVNKLREALCDSAEEPRYIETLPRRGYRFIASVEPAVSPLPAIIPAQPQVLVAEPIWKGSLAQEEWESTIPVKRQTLVYVWALLALSAVLGLGASGLWWYWSASRHLTEAELRLKQPGQLSVAEAAELRRKQAVERSSPHEPDVSRSERTQRNLNFPPEPPGHNNHSSLSLDQIGHALGLVQERTISDAPAILRLDLTPGRDSYSLKRVISGLQAIGGPQPSPDGKKLTFMWGRIDSMEIWVCNADGSSPQMITNMGTTGTPRWSPDSRWIAFDSDGRFGHSGIYVVSAEGGPVRPVVQDESNNSVPSWSHDGKYIYFASDRGGLWHGDQVWKVPVEGGRPVQITREGGFSAFESPDRQTLYYAKHRNQNPEIWQVPLNGGAESRVSLLRPSSWASWAITERGILLLSDYNDQASELQYFDFATTSVRSLGTLERASFWLSASLDGKSIWYSELTNDQARQVFQAGLN
jgi:Tol biopolymer transport system component/DNA-binding winged helix-turn-helix (wHTH) protein